MLARLAGTLAVCALVAGCSDAATSTAPVTGKAALFAKPGPQPACVLANRFQLYSTYLGVTYVHEYYVQRLKSPGVYNVTGQWISTSDGTIPTETDEQGTVTLTSPNNFALDVMFTAKSWNRQRYATSGTYDANGMVTNGIAPWSEGA